MNSFGRKFRVQIYGESHGSGVGIIIDGCPPGIPLAVEDFLLDLERRKPGAKGTTPRIETDIPELVSGVFNGFSTGTPINIFFKNTNVRSKDYSNLVKHPRPGHADFVAERKFKGFQDFRGGGHFSGRLTVCLVAAGVIAKKLIPEINVHAEVIEAGGEKDIRSAVDKALASQNSIGGIVECRAENVPVALGEPFFDSVEAVISHLAFSIPAIKGIEFGSGFSAAKMTGAEHNDNILEDSGKTETNNAGGINGGITNGNPLVFRLAVKPPSSIGTVQKTFNTEKKSVEELQIVGRHDACIALRVPVVCEAIAAIALADFSLLA